MSEWMLFNTKRAIFSYRYKPVYHGSLIVLACWNNITKVNPSLQSDTLSESRNNQSLFLLICAYRRSTIYKVYSVWSDTTWNQLTILYTHVEDANKYMTEPIPVSRMLLLSYMMKTRWSRIYLLQIKLYFL